MRILTATFSDTPTDAHLRHYLFKIAANLIIDAHRRSARTGEMPAQEPPTPSHEGPIVSYDFVTGALSQLRPIDRQLLWLAYVEELPHREIARQLSYKEPSIRPLLHKAKRKMLQILKGRNP